MSLLKDAEKTKVVVGDNYIIQSPMTGDWFAYIKGENRPWICEEKSEAMKLARKKPNHETQHTQKISPAINQVARPPHEVEHRQRDIRKRQMPRL